MAWLSGGAVMTPLLAWIVFIIYTALVTGCSIHSVLEQRKAKKEGRELSKRKKIRHKVERY